MPDRAALFRLLPGDPPTESDKRSPHERNGGKWKTMRALHLQAGVGAGKKIGFGFRNRQLPLDGADRVASISLSG